MKGTYFYTRVRKNPAFYSFDHVTDEAHLDSLLQDMCIRAVNDLAREKIVTFDAATLAIEPLEEAHNMTKHMIKFSTMCMLMNLKPDSNQQELFAELSKCEELSKVVLKRNEKTLLNNLHKGVCDTLHCGYSSLWLFYTLVILDCGYSTLWLFFTRITLHSGYSQLWLLYTRIILHCGYPPLIECVSFSVTHSFKHSITHSLIHPPSHVPPPPYLPCDTTIASTKAFVSPSKRRKPGPH